MGFIQLEFRPATDRCLPNHESLCAFIAYYPAVARTLQLDPSVEGLVYVIKPGRVLVAVPAPDGQWNPGYMVWTDATPDTVKKACTGQLTAPSDLLEEFATLEHLASPGTFWQRVDWPGLLDARNRALHSAVVIRDVLEFPAEASPLAAANVYPQRGTYKDGQRHSTSGKLVSKDAKRPITPAVHAARVTRHGVRGRVFHTDSEDERPKADGKHDRAHPDWWCVVNGIVRMDRTQIDNTVTYTVEVADPLCIPLDRSGGYSISAHVS